jgi:succinate dehydrogenase/fumarate reductase flavoprotein subunit
MTRWHECSRKHRNKAQDMFDQTVDAVVIGSGAAGLTAALVAKSAGLDVVVLEKTDRIGGNTAISGGAVWIPGNPHLPETGLSDSREAVLTYLRAIIGDRLRRDLVEAFLDAGPKAVAFLEAGTSVRFRARQLSPDYRSSLPGAALGGRAIEPKPFDGRQLGPHFALLREPLPDFTLFGGMMVNRSDVDALLGLHRSFRNFRHGGGLVFRFVYDRMRFPRGTRLLMGNALAGRLFKSALDAGITLRTESRATELILSAGRVTGVRVEHAGRSLRFEARRGVVLATGGFSADADMRARFIPLAHAHRSVAAEASTGDGIRLALRAGAVLETGNVGNAFWTPVSVLKNPDGSETRFPHLILDRQKPGLIAVNASGRRFVNEADSYHDFVEAMYRSHQTVPTIPVFLICDATFLRRYGLGLVRPYALSLRRFLAAGYLIRARTLRALAGRLGIDADGLEATVAAVNRYAASGHDPEFGKGSSAYNLHLGDPRHRPNPCLGTISTAPFYAVCVWPGDIGTALGLVVDARTRVLDAAGAPVPGLYACGSDMNSIMAGTYPGAGITLGPALAFGYIAGQQMAGDDWYSAVRRADRNRSDKRATASAHSQRQHHGA